MRLLTCLALVTILGIPAAWADEPLFEQLKEIAYSDVLDIGALVQVVGDYQADRSTGNNGFVLANFRLSVGGELDGGFGYFLQGSFTLSPGALDAAAWWRKNRWLVVKSGAFKAPLSGEFLTSAASIDFVDRAQIVRALAPGRQVGVQVAGDTDAGLGYALGIFNGNGLALGNDDNNVMTAGRIGLTSQLRGGLVAQGGLNAMHSRDTDAPIGITLTGDFIGTGYAGKRVVLGGDIRVTKNRWLGAAELLWGQFDPRGGERVNPLGFQATGGVHVTPKTQLLARWDSFIGDGALEDADIFVLGVNHWPTTPTEVQVNLLLPVSGSGGPRLLANFQIGF